MQSRKKIHNILLEIKPWLSSHSLSLFGSAMTIHTQACMHVCTHTECPKAMFMAFFMVLQEKKNNGNRMKRNLKFISKIS